MGLVVPHGVDNAGKTAGPRGAVICGGNVFLGIIDKPLPAVKLGGFGYAERPEERVSNGDAGRVDGLSGIGYGNVLRMYGKRAGNERRSKDESKRERQYLLHMIVLSARRRGQGTNLLVYYNTKPVR